MKALVAALAVMILSVAASAEDALVDGGLSPDKRFEVRIARDPNSDPSDYAIRIHAAKAKKPFYTLRDIGGLDRYPAAKQSCRALWHSSSQFVVFTDHGTRHSKEIYLLDVTPGHVERLQLPDYVQNALGRVNATEIDIHCLSTPKKWTDDDLLLTLFFSTSTLEHGRRFYTCDVTLHITHGQNQAAYVGLAKVTQPKEEEG